MSKECSLCNATAETIDQIKTEDIKNHFLYHDRGRKPDERFCVMCGNFAKNFTVVHNNRRLCWACEIRMIRK